MKDKYLIIILFLSQLFYSAAGQESLINIDIKRNDKLMLSSIASEHLKIPLETKIDLKSHRIWKVCMVDDCIYVLEGNFENKGWPERVLQFDNQGTFIRPIGYDIKTKSYLKVNDLFVDESKKIIILKCNHLFKVYDYEGNYLYLLKETSQGNYYFDGHFFSQDIYVKEGAIGSRLLCSNIAGSEVKEISIPAANPELRGDQSAGRSFNYSEKDNQLYISFGYDLKIYKLNNFQLEPIYEFAFENCSLSLLNVPPAPKQIICGNYIQYGYWLKNSPYGQNIFIYDTKSGKSFNIRLRYENGVLISGIKDDIWHTGFIQLKKTNREGYIFFTTNNINGKIVSENPLVFIAKLK